MSGFTYFTENHAVSMTLRDYFASQAMAAIIANKTLVDLYSAGSTSAAIQAYVIADAMLKARKP